MRVRFNPLALLLDSSLEGEYDLVQRIIYEVIYSCFYYYLLQFIYFGQKLTNCKLCVCFCVSRSKTPVYPMMRA